MIIVLLCLHKKFNWSVHHGVCYRVGSKATKGLYQGYICNYNDIITIIFMLCFITFRNVPGQDRIS